MTKLTDLMNSPLAEATPETSLSHLFALDPLKLTDDDVAKIVAEQRKRRAEWNEKEDPKQAGKALGRPKAAPASKKKAAAGPTLSLEDLGIKLI